MKSAKSLLIIFIVLCCIFIAYYVKATDVSNPKITLITKETSLVKFEKGKTIREDATVSPDNQRIAYIESKESTPTRVVVNGTPGKIYDYFSAIGCAFSPNGKHLAYMAGMKDKKHFIVLDGVEGPGGYIDIGYPTFSPDSKQLAYQAGDNEARKEVVLLNGEKVGEYGRIVGTNNGKGLVFSPDGKRLGFVAGNGKENFVVVDGKEGKYYDSVTGFMFSKDSQHLMYNARTAGKRIIVKDETEIAESNSLQSAVFSPDFSRIACIYNEGDKKYVVVDGKQGKQYDNITELKFSPNGKRFAYAACSDSDRTMHVVVDGQEQKNYRWVMNITFSPNSERVAYLAGPKGEQYEHCIVVDGVEGKQYNLQELRPNFNVSPPVFSPDSKHVGYVVEMGDESWMVVDEIEGRHYDKIRKETIDGWNCKWDKSFVFSPEGKIAYWAKKGSEWMVVVDGVESGAYWGYPEDGKIVFEGPNLLSFVAFRDMEMFRVEIEIKHN